MAGVCGLVMSTRKGGAASTCVDEAAQSEEAACLAETLFHNVREQHKTAQHHTAEHGCQYVLNTQNNLDRDAIRLSEHSRIHPNPSHLISPHLALLTLHETNFPTVSLPCLAEALPSRKPSPCTNSPNPFHPPYASSRHALFRTDFEQ